MSEIKPKKMVSRNVAVALGIICILLIAVIAYFSITSISAQNSYNTLQNQNNQLQAWLDGNETSLSQTQTWLDGNVSQNANLQGQADSLQNQVNSLEAPKLIEANLSGRATTDHLPHNKLIFMSTGMCVMLATIQHITPYSM